MSAPAPKNGRQPLAAAQWRFLPEDATPSVPSPPMMFERGVRHGAGDRKSTGRRGSTDSKASSKATDSSFGGGYGRGRGKGSSAKGRTNDASRYTRRLPPEDFGGSTADLDKTTAALLARARAARGLSDPIDLSSAPASASATSAAAASPATGPTPAALAGGPSKDGAPTSGHGQGGSSAGVGSRATDESKLNDDDGPVFSTDQLLASIAKELGELEGASAAFRAAGGMDILEPAHAVSPSVTSSRFGGSAAPSSSASRINQADGSQGSRPASASTLSEDCHEPPIVWKSEPGSRLEYCLPPELRTSSLDGSSASLSTMFPQSYNLARSKRSSAPPPMKFGVSKNESTQKKNRFSYGAWYVPSSRWKVTEGGGGSLAPASDRKTAAQLEQEEILEKTAACQAQLPHLDISRKWKAYCSREHGRVPRFLANVGSMSLQPNPGQGSGEGAPGGKHSPSHSHRRLASKDGSGTVKHRTSSASLTSQLTSKPGGSPPAQASARSRGSGAASQPVPTSPIVAAH